MNEGRTSPKRQHILSSINPDEDSHDRRSRERTPRTRSPSARPASDTRPAARHDEPSDVDDKTRPRRSKLKLKGERSKHRSRHHSRERRRRHDDDDESRSHRRHRRHHRRRSRSPTPPNPHDPEPLDPEAAFRESLFDAMADDEGAAYWEGVYGQPVHVYSQEKVGPQGELERMTEEEYAAYVRQKMWEKTHAGLLEERARREEQRKKKEREERHSRKLQQDMEQSLRRGEERRLKRRWTKRWEDYTSAWERWDGTPGAIYWPLVDGSKGEEINEEDVRSFFTRGLELEEIGEEAFVTKLKDERVRWHPDKIQQRLGGKVDEAVMRDVTAIFQIIDRLWTDMRRKGQR
ncbi:hypothetical protein K4F52_007897 [Lecanicillium sp. MT-2017a]|nr:hypothetical protein K4F52_007897 [Lecanicillium sp. MT-2017a]